MSKNDPLVNEALQYFGIPHAHAELIKTSNNHVYRVTDASKSYVLRIHQPDRRKLEWIESELMWLKAIKQDTDLYVPEPAAPVYTTTSDEKSVHCTLLHWLDGEQVLPNATTPEQARMIGVFIAHLHNHSTKFMQPAVFTLPRLDWDGIFGAKSPYHTESHNDLFTIEQQSVLNQIGQRVQDVMAKLDGFGIIHADLIWKNILFNGDAVGAIDFDDCAYGYYLYDLAPPLLGYMDEPNYPEIRTALWDGYTSLRTQPASFNNHLDTLIAGRYALSCRWIAANRHNPSIGERAPEIIAFRTGELRRYLETGKLHRGEIII